MTPNLLDELEKIVALSGEATPGEWSVATHGLPEDHWRVADCGGSKSSLPNPLVVAAISDYCKPAESDAEYITALHNWFRTHAPTLADMAKRMEAAERDAAYFRWHYTKEARTESNALVEIELRILGDDYPTIDEVRAAYAEAIDATQEGEG